MFKSIKKIITIIVIIVIAYIVLSFLGFINSDGKGNVKVEESEIDIGRLILGDKISIRDKIVVTKKGNYYIDGDFLGLGNERKEVSLSFFTELGYRMKDIISSGKIDTIVDGELHSRTLVLELPLPDTLLFLFKNKQEKDKGWFWEGYLTDNNYNNKIRNRIIDSLSRSAYTDLKYNYVYRDITSCVELSTLSVFNYVNNGYKIANERGFDYVIANFSYSIDGMEYKTQVTCNSNGECFASKKINSSNFEELKR